MNIIIFMNIFVLKECLISLILKHAFFKITLKVNNVYNYCTYNVVTCIISNVLYILIQSLLICIVLRYLHMNISLASF